MRRLLRWLRARLTRRHAPACPVGARGEAAAADYLLARGYAVLARNLRVPMGEADLVCADPDGRTIVLVEVKSRRLDHASVKSAAIPPEAAVHRRKAAKLRAIAAYLRQRNGWTDRPLRIDVVAVRWLDGDTTRPPDIRHFRAAV